MHRSPDDAPSLDFLLPLSRAGEHIPAAPGEPVLTTLYRHPSVTGEVYVRANMISTLDGAATGPDRLSGSINGAADARVFQVARAVADVVLIGAGTARAEGYGALEIDAELAEARHRRGQGRTLELALVSGSGPIPDRLLDSDHPPYVLTGSARPDLAALRSRIGADRVLVAGTGRSVDLEVGLRQLADRGLSRVLAEGGPHLLSELLDADARGRAGATDRQRSPVVDTCHGSPCPSPACRWRAAGQVAARRSPGRVPWSVAVERD
jgi:riboflavin biosynthesis pyrimidine reductase